MKKIGIIITILFYLCIPEPTSAVNLLSDIDITSGTAGVNAGEVINNDYVGISESVVVSGTVNGDAYLTGGQIIVDGSVTGDVIALGGSITINGQIGGNVRAVGGQIIIGATIGRNISVAAGNVDVTQATAISGNALVAAGNTTISAPLPNNLKLAAGNATLTNTVGGDVAGGVGKLSLTSKAIVEGDLTYLSEQEVQIAPPATVSGLIQRKFPHEYENAFYDQDQVTSQVRQSVDQVFNKARAIAFLSSLLIGILFIRLLPNFTYQAIRNIEDRPWAVFLIGLVGLIITPIAFLFLLATVIGIPLALILLAYYLAILYLAGIIFSYWLGARMVNRLGRFANHSVTLFVGMGTMYVLTSISFIGPIFTLASLIWGVGTLYLTKYDTYHEARITKLL